MYLKTKLILFLVLFFSSCICFAQLVKPNLEQYKTYEEKKLAWKTYSAKMWEIANKPQSNISFLDVINACKEGIFLLKQDDLKDIARYNRLIGSTFSSYGKHDSASVYLNTAKKIYEQIGDLDGKIACMRFLNYAYYNTAEFSKRESLINEAKAILETSNDDQIKSIILSILSEYYDDKAHYEISIKYKLESAELLKKLLTGKNKEVNHINIGVLYAQIAETYLTIRNYTKTLEYLGESLKYSSKSNKQMQINAYLDYVRAYLGLNQVENARIAFRKLTVLAENQFSAKLSTANKSFAEYFLQLKKIDSALKYAKHAVVLSKVENKPNIINEATATMGKVSFQSGQFEIAIKQLNTSLTKAYNFDKTSYASIAYKLAESYAAVGKFEDAYKHYVIYSKLQDTLYREASKKSIAEMDAKYHREVSMQEIKLLNTQNSKKNIQLKEEKRTRWFLISGTLLLLIALLSIYFNFRNKQKVNFILDKKNQQLDLVNSQLNTANQTKAKLFSIISHDLRSPVSQLFTFLRIQQVNPNQISEEEKAGYQKKLMGSASKLLETMEDLLLWSKSQLEHFELAIEEIDIIQLFEESIMLMQNQADTKNVQIKVGALQLNSLKSDQNLLIIVLRNLLQNAINHTYNNTSILLNAGINEKKKPFISIVNKGDIIHQEKIDELLSNHNIKSASSGYGLVIVKELLEKINSDLRITSSNELTTVQITFN